MNCNSLKILDKIKRVKDNKYLSENIDNRVIYSIILFLYSQEIIIP